MCSGTWSRPGIRSQRRQQLGSNDKSIERGGLAPSDRWPQAFLDWVVTVARDQTPDELVAMFQKESREFLDEPSLDEAIDCLANLVHWAHLSGVDSDVFSERAFERLAVWRNRTWE
ncbi:MAG: hypothetical protein ACYCTE_09480 [Acidimicrobiales bacterium]